MDHRTPTEQRNLALVLKFFDEVLKPMDSSAVDRFVPPDYIQHSSLVANGAAGLKAFLDSETAQWSKVVVDVRRSFVDGQHVIMQYHVRRSADDPGLAVIDIYRVDGDRIVEHWESVQPMPEKLPHGNGMF